MLKLGGFEVSGKRNGSVRNLRFNGRRCRAHLLRKYSHANFNLLIEFNLLRAVTRIYYNSIIIIQILYLTVKKKTDAHSRAIYLSVDIFKSFDYLIGQ